jgi:hypothetical protein
MRGHPWSGLALLVIAATACGSGRAAPVARAQPKTAAPAASAASSVAGAPAPPSVPVASPEGCRLDPLGRDALACGDPIDNPHGYAKLGVRPDGSCKTQCEPKPAPSVCKHLAARPIDAAVLNNPPSGTVRLRGSLGVDRFLCTRRGGLCACNNQCSGTLRLTSPFGSPSGAELGARATLLGLDLTELTCPGDDASVCCPLGLGGETRSLEVIVTGKLLPADSATEPRLVVADLCRVPLPARVEPKPALSGGELVDLSEGNRAVLANQARSIWAELLVAVSERPKPEPDFRIDGDPYTVRLASFCLNDDPLVAASDGLLLLAAALAHASAYDRVFSKNAVASLSAAMARRIDGNEGLAGLTELELPRTRDPHVLALQHEYFDSTVRFLLAHELLHWTLPHSPCSPEAQATQRRVRRGCIEPAHPYTHEIEADELAARFLRQRSFRPRGALTWFRFLHDWERPGKSGIRTPFQRASLPPALRASLIEEGTR